VNGDGKAEKILNDIMGERYEFSLMGQKPPVLNFPDKVVLQEQQILCAKQALITAAVLPTPTVSRQENLALQIRRKTNLNYHCREAA
jgi:hypothetical protein